MASLDMKALSTADRVVGAASLVALVSLFLPWYGASAFGFSASVSGLATSYGWLGALLVVAAGAYLLLLRSGARLPALPFGPGIAVLGASLVGTVVVALRWVTLPRGSLGADGVTYASYGPRVGIVLTLVAGIAQLAAAFTLFKRSGEAVPWGQRRSASEKDRSSKGG